MQGDLNVSFTLAGVRDVRTFLKDLRRFGIAKVGIFWGKRQNFWGKTDF
jgi:hypothetical protein